MALRSMEGVKKAAFGIALFDNICKMPIGNALIPATSSGVAAGLQCVQSLRAEGGNGGEAACLNACLAMGPQAVFFLGDGGWDASALMAAASGCGAVIHSIAFFTSGGGLQEIAASTGGVYREIHGVGDLARDTSPSRQQDGGIDDLDASSNSDGSEEESDESFCE